MIKLRPTGADGRELRWVTQISGTKCGKFFKGVFYKFVLYPQPRAPAVRNFGGTCPASLMVPAYMHAPSQIGAIPTFPNFLDLQQTPTRHNSITKFCMAIKPDERKLFDHAMHMKQK